MEKEENLEKKVDADVKVASWEVYVLDQGHYGFTQCSNCRYELKMEDPYDKCSGCGYKMQGINPSYHSGGSDF